MPKSNISRFTGIDVQPDPNGPLHGSYVPQLTTAQRDKLVPVANGGELRNGAVIYNTTINYYQVYQPVGGANQWFNLQVAAAPDISGAGLGSPPFVLPLGTKAVTEVPTNQTPAFLFYDQTTRRIRIYTNNYAGNAPQWQTIFANATVKPFGVATPGEVGIGLTSGSPLCLPSGAAADVEIDVNTVIGFTYLNTTTGQTRQYAANGAGPGTPGWVTIFATALNTVTGVGLINGSPVVLPRGPRNTVEVAANALEGFIYLDTSVNPTVIRYRNNTGWLTLTAA